jgi:DNA-binding YbaB/EbfC family protein
VFKGLGNIASLVKQAQEMGAKMQEMTEELRHQRTTGTAGGGLVTVEANGLAEVLSVRLDPKLFEQGDRELAEDLITAAVGQALVKAKEMHVEAMKSLTGGVDMPGMTDALARLTGGPGPG